MVIKLSMGNIKFFYTIHRTAKQFYNGTNIIKCNIKCILLYFLLISDNLKVNRLFFIL